MELTFDIRGHLIPYKRIELSLDQFEEFFVNSFEINSSRREIFKNYQRYVSDFQEHITTNFIHWINGSYVTNKKNPGDIDFVTLINHEDYRKKRDLVDSRFRLQKAKEIYKVDAYTVEIYPEGHKKYLIYKSDLVYWDNWFGKTKKNWAKKSFPKGYIELKFND